MSAVRRKALRSIAFLYLVAVAGIARGQSVVVGSGTAASGYSEAFRWTAGTGMVSLGDIPGGYFESGALAVSADGSVVVGYDSWAWDFHDAFHWTAASGMKRLWDVLLENGVDPAAHGWTGLTEAHGISADGNTIVGEGVRNGAYEPFVAVIPEPASSGLLAVAACALLRRRRHRKDGR